MKQYIREAVRGYVRELSADLNVRANLRRADLEIAVLAPAPDLAGWLQLAHEHGYERTRIALALGLSLDAWRSLAPYPDVTLDLLKRPKPKPRKRA